MSYLETIVTGRFISLVKRGKWEYVTRSNASGIVIVVPETGDGKLLFVEQFRPPVDRKVIEFPAGLAGDIAGQENEALAQAAERELEEETGYRASEMNCVYTGPSSAGLCDEISSIFLARDLKKVADGGGVGGENIVVHEVPRADAHEWLEMQQANDYYVAARVYTGLYFFERS